MRVGKFLLLPLVVLSLASASRDWPQLPKHDFVHGRAATKRDVMRKKAIFVLDEGGGPVGSPVKMQIPQYIYMKEKRQYGILIQAEDGPDGVRFFGIRLFDGTTMVALRDDIELLGRTPKH